MHRLTPPKGLAPFLAAAILLAAGSVRAQGLIPRDEGFMKPPSSVQNRIHSLDGTHDLSVLFAFSFKNPLTQHFGGVLQWQPSFNEYFALDVMLGGGLGSHAGLVDRIRENAASGNVKADFEDAGALMGYGSVGVRFTPAYGKLSLSSELPLHFHAYFVGGVGGALVDYNGVLTCAEATTNNRCRGEFKSELAPSLSFNVGVGMRFLINQKFSVKAELRDVMFFDRWYEGGELTTGFSALTHTPLIMLGLGVLL